jgi:hypothetical protein
MSWNVGALCCLACRIVKYFFQLYDVVSFIGLHSKKEFTLIFEIQSQKDQLKKSCKKNTFYRTANLFFFFFHLFLHFDPFYFQTS